MNDASFPGWRPEKSIQVTDADGRTRVLVKGQLYMSWPSGDEGCLRLAIVQLHECGVGTRDELAEAFGRHRNSVQRYFRDFAEAGFQGLMAERRGPKGPWKLTPELRGKVLLIVLRDGVEELEAIQQRVAEIWHEEVSLPSIELVLRENGLGEPQEAGSEGALAQGELFAVEGQPQLLLDLDPALGPPQDPALGSRGLDTQNAMGHGSAPGGQVGGGEPGSGGRRNYSSAQRVYLDQLEQGAYNAYAGGLLFVPLLARYQFLPTLRPVITIPTHEGYSLDELALTLFYLDVFAFRSMEDFKRAYREEFGVLVGRSQSPSLFTLRRFLHRVRELGRGETLIDEFAVNYLKSGLAQWGVMYIDGHFMPYYGLHPISKGWHFGGQIN